LLANVRAPIHIWAPDFSLVSIPFNLPLEPDEVCQLYTSDTMSNLHTFNELLSYTAS